MHCALFGWMGGARELGDSCGKRPGWASLPWDLPTISPACPCCSSMGGREPVGKAQPSPAQPEGNGEAAEPSSMLRAVHACVGWAGHTWEEGGVLQGQCCRVETALPGLQHHTWLHHHRVMLVGEAGGGSVHHCFSCPVKVIWRVNRLKAGRSPVKGG